MTKVMKMTGNFQSKDYAMNYSRLDECEKAAQEWVGLVEERRLLRENLVQPPLPGSELYGGICIGHIMLDSEILARFDRLEELDGRCCAAMIRYCELSKAYERVNAKMSF